MRTFTVYLYWDANGQPLYVGYTSQFRVRDQCHRRSSEWADRIDRVECEQFEDINDALDREHAQIAALSPEFNRMTRRSNLSAAPAEKHAVSFRLSDDAQRLLMVLAYGQGISKTEALEVLIRETAERRGVK